ncbi:MAG: biopolymer transporter ExbD [Epsilonproteobacteria bacterium]|nr:biopolymer transporter ExbD [Campylobacterota bacterium]
MKNNDQAIWQINITPFVDVILVVLIIVMVTAPMLTKGINVNLPKASSSKAKVNRKDIIISVDKNGVFYFNDTRSSIKGIRDRLAESGNRRVLIKSDKSVPYGTIVNLIDMIKSLGMQKIGLLTTPKRSKIR